MGRHEQYDNFLKEFPLESLPNMPLEKYTNSNKDSFIYWIEFGTTELGSMQGGSSAKFGIYEYQTEPTGNKVVYDDKYAWYKKYNCPTATEAYEKVRKELTEIANNARKGDFEKVDKSDFFGDIYKWKIAFMYSNLSIVPIYKREMLEFCAKDKGMTNTKNATIPELQKYLMHQKNSLDFFVYYEDLLKIIKKDVKYWVYSPGEQAYKWPVCTENNIMCIGWDELGDFSLYKKRDDIKEAMKKAYPEKANPNSFTSFMNDSLAVWEFSNAVKPGDIVFVKKGRQKYLGRGIVEGEYFHDESFENYTNIRDVKWTNVGEWESPNKHSIVLKTLTDITKYPDYVKQLEALFAGDQESEVKPYSKSDFLKDVFLEDAEYERLKSLLLYKKNIILQGAPGVGKTYSAKRIAYSIIGEKNDSKIEFVQFHQNYSYEDFVMGYKPTDDGGFRLENGIFYKFCRKAQSDPNGKYFFIIDEINRGNLSKIFGELFMLIENDHRGENIKLAYRDENFNIPSNIYLIGMMNTADRSLAMIDYALRRRFCFYNMQPAFETMSFQNFVKDKNSDKFSKVIDGIKALNKEIEKDDSLGKGFMIGHSYFCSNDVVNNLENIINFEIIPMLSEYWFDNAEKFRTESDKLKDCLK